MTDRSWRVFCAVDVSDDLRRVVSKHSSRVREKHDRVRAAWVNEADLHLTIKFIGNIATQRVEAVSDAAARAVNGLAQFPIEFEGTGVFPGPRSPRVLWIGIADQTAGLAQLHSSLEQECVAAGFPEEERPFHPHLTIARIREPQLARALATDHLNFNFMPIQMLVAELFVIRSQMSSKGPNYTVITRHPLS